MDWNKKEFEIGLYKDVTVSKPYYNYGYKSWSVVLSKEGYDDKFISLSTLTIKSTVNRSTLAFLNKIISKYNAIGAPLGFKEIPTLKSNYIEDIDQHMGAIRAVFNSSPIIKIGLIENKNGKVIYDYRPIEVDAFKSLTEIKEIETNDWSQAK